MKKFIVIMIILLIAVAAGAYVAYERFTPSTEQTEFNPSKEPQVYTEGRSIDLADPYIDTGRHLLLSMQLSEMVTEAHYYWDQPEQTLVVTTYDHVFRFQPEREFYMENGRPVDLDTPLQLINETPYIPVQFLERVLNVEMDFSAENQVLMIEEKRECRLYAEVIVESAALRQSPSIKSPMLSASLTEGTTLTVYETYEKWLRVKHPSGIIGYIQKSDVKRYEQCRASSETVSGRAAAWQPETGKINLVWEVSSNPANISPMPGLDVVSPTWYDIVGEDGRVSNRVNQNYINWARRHGYVIWPLVTNNFDPDLTSAILASTEVRESIIEQLLSSVTAYGMDGINIDFENVYLDDRDRMTQFVRELTPLFREKGLVVSMDVTILSSSEMWSMFYDREEIGKLVDYMAIMTYDQHWGSSPVAGSVAEYDWVENGLRGVLTQVPPEKILLGLPFYTRLWEEREVDGAIRVSSRALTMPQAQQIIARRNLEPEWDGSSGQYYVEYSEGSSRFRMWIENDRSIDLKSSLIHRYNLAGAASWRRGFETPDIWETLAQNLKETDDYAGWAASRGYDEVVF